MWVANAATVSPSADTADGRVHFTPANLVAHFHRSIEAPTTTRVLRAIFADARALRRARSAAAAPQTRRRGRGEPHALRRRRRRWRRVLRLRPRARYGAGAGAARFPGAADARSVARRSRAGTASTRARRSSRSRIPRAIDAGVFHNDVIAVGARQRRCSATSARGVDAARACIDALGARGRRRVRADRRRANDERLARRRRRDLSVQQPAARARTTARCCSSRRPSAARTRASRAVLDRLRRAGRADRRGARPSTCARACATAAAPRACACASPLTDDERAAIRANVFLDDALADALDAWIRRHYRDRLAPRRPRPIPRCSTNRGARSTS